MSRREEDAKSKRAKRENFLARSIYKLEEIDKRDAILRGANIVLDLGASPGSWTQYCLKKLSAEAKIFAIDLAPLKVQDPRVHFVMDSISQVNIKDLCPNGADLVLSDMAPKTSGIHEQDVALSLELAQEALRIATENLRHGRHFVVKLFMGDGFERYHTSVKRWFESVRLLRPETTRKHSREIYFVAKGLQKTGRL